MTQRDDAGLGSRDRILRAAMRMFGEDPGTRLTVRGVATRAGVSMGSLRHHFPTQRALQDEVLTRVYDLVLPDDRIHDTAAPARDRLVDCLRQLLSPTGVGAQARRTIRTIAEDVVAPEPTEERRAAYLAVDREIRRRAEYWLTVLADEGALTPGDHARRAKFLLTVVSGLSLERALPAEDSLLAQETATLYTAVDGILAEAPGC